MVQRAFQGIRATIVVMEPTMKTVPNVEGLVYQKEPSVTTMVIATCVVLARSTTRNLVNTNVAAIMAHTHMTILHLTFLLLPMHLQLYKQE